MSEKAYNCLVQDLFPTGRIQAGEVGIEIEVEGTRLPRELASYWSVHQDGSLRGESAEYVLSKPIKRENIFRYLTYLKKKLDDAGASVTSSIRTSVHVHLNTQGMMMRQVYSLICLYLLFEDLLTEYAGPNRVGNLFCLRAKDAEFLCTSLVRCAEDDNYRLFREENRLRYSSVNVCALHKFNSLEFRAFRGTVLPEQITAWTNLLLALKDASTNYPDPRMICHDFSSYGPVEFMRRVFPTPLYEQFNVPTSRVVSSLWDGIRMIQDIAHATNWEVTDSATRSRVFGTITEEVGGSLEMAVPDWQTVRANSRVSRRLDPTYRVNTQRIDGVLNSALSAITTN